MTHTHKYTHIHKHTQTKSTKEKFLGRQNVEKILSSKTQLLYRMKFIIASLLSDIFVLDNTKKSCFKNSLQSGKLRHKQ